MHGAPTLAAPLAPPPAPYGQPPGPPGPPQQPQFGQIPGQAPGHAPGQFPGQGQPPGAPAPYGQPAPPPYGGHTPAAPTPAVPQTGPGLQAALQPYREAPTGQRWTPQNQQLMRVDLGKGDAPVLARQGSMVMYQGKVDFGYKSAGFAGRIVGNATGQEMQLMRCTGRGQVFLAEEGAHLHPIELQGDAICVSAENVLAFDEALQYEVRRIEGHGIPGGALFTMQFQGTGTVVVKTHGVPVVLPVTPTTFADANAVVAWSAASQVILSSQVRLRRNAYPGHSGETVNLQFRGAPATSSSSSRTRSEGALHMNQQLAGFAPTPVTARMENHGRSMLKVAMTSGQDLYARTGSMIAYEGFVQYEPNPPAVRQIAGQWVAGEGTPVMKCAGDDLLYLADYGADVVVVNLNNDALSVNGTNLLAFDAHLQWGVERVKGLAKFAGQGLWNVTVSGVGWVALTSRHTDRGRLRPGRGRDVRRPRRPRGLVARAQGQGQAQLQGLVADRTGQRRGVPDGLLGPGHRRRTTERGQHRPPAGPGLRGRKHHAEPAFRTRGDAVPGTLCRAEPAAPAGRAHRPGRRPRPQGRDGRLPGTRRLRRRVPARGGGVPARAPARGWT